jgi:hypothetical protein
MNSHYAIIIQWPDEDQCYVVSLPEWGRTAIPIGIPIGLLS